eukprot:jgi/Astpho2/5622/Aster-02874
MGTETSMGLDEIIIQHAQAAKILSLRVKVVCKQRVTQTVKERMFQKHWHKISAVLCQSTGQAVIFILEHSDESSVGLILNKPTEFLVHQVLGAEDITPEFRDNRIFLGGDVGLDTTFLLHPHGQLPESVEIVNGVFMGGCNAARAAVREGHKKAEDFKSVAGVPTVVHAGCWLLAAASKGVILEQGLHNRAMWHHVLELMGGDHELLSKWVKKQYPKDMLETILRNDESP